MKRILSSLLVIVVLVSACSNSQDKLKQEAVATVTEYQNKFDGTHSYEYTESYVDYNETTQYTETQIYDKNNKSLEITFFEKDSSAEGAYEVELSYKYDEQGELLDYQATLNGKAVNKNQDIKDEYLLSKDEEIARVDYLFDQVIYFTNLEDFKVEENPDNYYTVTGVNPTSKENVTDVFDENHNYMLSTYTSSSTTTEYSLEYKD